MQMHAHVQDHAGLHARREYVCESGESGVYPLPEDRRGLGPGEMQAVGRFVRIGTEDLCTARS